MKEESGGSEKESMIMSLIDKKILKVEIIKTLSGNIFGPLLLGKLTYEGEYESNYTYIKRLDKHSALDQADFWKLVSSTKQHPGKGFLPHIIAYSTFPHVFKGYHDAQNSFEDLQEELFTGDDYVLNIDKEKVKELYFDPFPETLKMMLHKRIKDKKYFTEAELAHLLVSVLSTLQSLEEHKLFHGMVSLECIVPVAHTYYLYHPILIPKSVNLFSKIHSLGKHYGAPEVVELILECNSEDEFFKIKEEVDWSKADIFSLALVVLELCTLVEEDDWYNDEMMLKKDILEVKLNMVKDQYSSKLARLLETMLSPYQVRPSIKGLLTLALSHSQDFSQYQKLLQKGEQRQQAQEAVLQNKREICNSDLSRNFESNKEVDSVHDNPEEVSEIDSKEMNKFENRKPVHKKERDSFSENFSKNHETERIAKESNLDSITPRFESKEAPVALSHIPKEPPEKISTILYPSMISHDGHANAKPQERLEVPKPSSSLTPGIHAVPQIVTPSPQSHQDRPLPQETRYSRVVLPPTQSCNLAGFHTYTGVPTDRIISAPANNGAYAISPRLFHPMQQASPSPSRIVSQGFPTTIISTLPHHIHEHVVSERRSPSKETVHVGKPILVREDRSKSPRLVKTKTFLIKNGQKILISEENYPEENKEYVQYTDLREPTVHHYLRDASPASAIKIDTNRADIKKDNYKPEEVSKPPLITQKSLEPVFGKDSSQRSNSIQGPKLHSLAAINQQPQDTDFRKMLGEIHLKAQDLIAKEIGREEREKKLLEDARISRNKGLTSDDSVLGSNLNSSSNGTLRIKHFDLSDVQCCQDCERMKFDKRGQLYKCLNHPKSPLHKERLTPSKRSKKAKQTPEPKKISVERKLFPTYDHHDPNMCPRYYKSFFKTEQQPKSKSSKKLIALPLDENALANEMNNLRSRGDDKVVELVNLTKVNKIKESLAEARQRRLKKALDGMPTNNIQGSRKSKSKSRSKSNQRNKGVKGHETKTQIGGNIWMNLIKKNEGRK
jgi:hypothetical protein